MRETRGRGGKKVQCEKRVENGFRTVATMGAVQIVGPGTPPLGFGGRNS
jgi:hypothetical protein